MSFLTQLTVQELVIRDAWMNWEENLRRAHQNRMLAWAMTRLQLPWDHLGNQVGARRLSAEEEEQFTMWKSRYIYQPADFEDERLAAYALGLGE